jgi:hypothetical protein
VTSRPLGPFLVQKKILSDGMQNYFFSYHEAHTVMKRSITALISQPKSSSEEL